MTEDTHAASSVREQSPIDRVADAYLGARLAQSPLLNMSEEFVRFELDRYLGFPDPAPSYKIGERWWIELRDEVPRREGNDFDLSAFHHRARNIGSAGLDVLRSAVLETV